MTDSLFKDIESHQHPYNHWYVKNIFSEEIEEALKCLPFSSPHTRNISGTREVHNKSRNYFNLENQNRFDIIKNIASIFQDSSTVQKIQHIFQVDIEDCFLRIEYAVDTEGFWLQPHTDLGVKKFTMLYYLDYEEGNKESLGTDIYSDKNTWIKTAPFIKNHALVFIPSDHTWHGFEKRQFSGERKSLIINYVTREWINKGELSFPDCPVST